MVDTNVYLSRWPFRRLPGDEPARLVATLRQHGMEQAWAGSFDGLLHKDVAAVNARLASDCRQYGNGMLLPFGTVNPTLPDWKEDLRRCHELHRMRGIRLHPNYHGYDVNNPLFGEVLEAAAARRLIVQLVCCMEDERTQNPLVRVGNVELSPLADQLRRVAAARVQILNWKNVDNQQARRLALTGQAYFDFAMAEGAGALARLLRLLPIERVLFGSNFPLFYFESAWLKVREAGLASSGEQAVLGRSAQSLLARMSVSQRAAPGKTVRPLRTSMVTSRRR